MNYAQAVSRRAFPPRSSRGRMMSRYQRYFNMSGLGADPRVIPTRAQIRDWPVSGFWYRIKKGETWWGVAKKAYGSDNLKRGLLLMNKATWNDHIDRRKKGWEPYKIAGLQATPDYSAARPHAPKGSGNDYPTAWIPPLDGAEPETIFPPPIPGEPGEPGKPGEQGKPGTPGPPGPPGPMGPAGARGPAGPVGPRGPAGPPGQATDAAIMKAINDWIAKHPDKARGPAGPAGPRGATGARGPGGLPGARGPAGPVGPRGPAGPPGQATDAAIMQAVRDWMDAHPDKIRGPAGTPGMVGPRGPMGPVGPRGPAGPPGPSGGGGQSGTGDKSNMWVLPMLALVSTVA